MASLLVQYLGGLAHGVAVSPQPLVVCITLHLPPESHFQTDFESGLAAIYCSPLTKLQILSIRPHLFLHLYAVGVDQTRNPGRLSANLNIVARHQTSRAHNLL